MQFYGLDLVQKLGEVKITSIVIFFNKATNGTEHKTPKIGDSRPAVSRINESGAIITANM